METQLQLLVKGIRTARQQAKEAAEQQKLREQEELAKSIIELFWKTFKDFKLILKEEEITVSAIPEYTIPAHDGPYRYSVIVFRKEGRYPLYMDFTSTISYRIYSELNTIMNVSEQMVFGDWLESSKGKSCFLEFIYDWFYSEKTIIKEQIEEE